MFFWGIFEFFFVPGKDCVKEKRQSLKKFRQKLHKVVAIEEHI
jgi:hypothetical protein